MIRNIIRGCGTLPHVGPHPGTWTMFMFVLVGGLAGVGKGGLHGALIGAAVMGLGMLPLYLIGAYERAKDSDAINAKEAK